MVVTGNTSDGMHPAHTEYIADKCDCLLEVKKLYDFYLGHCNSMVVIYIIAQIIHPIWSELKPPQTTPVSGCPGSGHVTANLREALR